MTNVGSMFKTQKLQNSNDKKLKIQLGHSTKRSRMGIRLTSVTMMLNGTLGETPDLSRKDDESWRFSGAFFIPMSFLYMAQLLLSGISQGTRHSEPRSTRPLRPATVILQVDWNNRPASSHFGRGKEKKAAITSYMTLPIRGDGPKKKYSTSRYHHGAQSMRDSGVLWFDSVQCCPP